MDMKNYTNWVIIGAIAVIVLAGGWWFFMEKPADAGPNTLVADVGTGNSVNLTNPYPGTSYATTTTAGETVRVQNQNAGSSVVISSMNLSRESWIAVRDSRSILGASRFSAGATSGTVKLLRPTEAGKSYTLVVFIDDGDKKFDFRVDPIVPMEYPTFSAQ